jgi:hypothetical protein
MIEFSVFRHDGSGRFVNWRGVDVPRVEKDSALCSGDQIRKSVSNSVFSDLRAFDGY